MVAELKMVCTKRKATLWHKFEHVKPTNFVAAVQEQIEILATQDVLKEMGAELITELKNIFVPIPHLDELPMDSYCHIRLKDFAKTVKTCSYLTLQKYREAWATLIQQHLDARYIWPSNSEHASPAFIVPKADSTVLQRWVNDYWILNDNTVLDAHLLPQVDNILTDCTKGKIWSKMDMTNSFFQT
jgi:hypothetical protein